MRESCVLNVLVVGADGVVRTPPFKRALAGTTVRRAFELLRADSAAAANERHAGVAYEMAQEEIPVEAARRAREVMLLAGDRHLFSITKLDGAPIGDGKPGPVARRLRVLLDRDALSPAGEGGGQEHDPLF